MAARGLAANASRAGFDLQPWRQIRAIGALLERTRQAFSARIPSLTQKERFSMPQWARESSRSWAGVQRQFWEWVSDD
jgi:hypothetical protein